MSRRKYKYRIGEKLFSRKLGWYLGSFVETATGSVRPYHVVKFRSPGPSMLHTGACMDQPPNRQGYSDVMIGNEAEIRQIGLEPEMHGKHQQRRYWYGFIEGWRIAFDRFGYEWPRNQANHTCEGVILAEEQGAKYVRQGDEYIPNPEYVGHKIRVLKKDAESVLAKLRQRAVDAAAAGVFFADKQTGLPRDIQVETDRQGLVLTLPRDGVCGGYLFMPILKY